MTEKKETENKEKVRKIAERVLHRNAERLFIDRVPKKTKEDFLDLANEEFCGDYGMLLKWLMDGLIGKDTQILLTKIDAINMRIDELEEKFEKALVVMQEPEKKTIKKLDGSRIEVQKQ